MTNAERIVEIIRSSLKRNVGNRCDLAEQITRDLIQEGITFCKCDKRDDDDREKFFTGKARCIAAPQRFAFTVGKVYEFKDGLTRIDNGNIVYASHQVRSIEEWNERSGKFAMMEEI